MVNLKVIIAFALVAMILSILAGGIGGVPFWEIIVRSLFGAVIFGGLGFGIGFIIDRYLPELTSSGNNPIEKPAKGTEIDEIIDSENPYEDYQADFGEELDMVKESSAAGSYRKNKKKLESEDSADMDAAESFDSSDLSNIEETAAAESVSYNGKGSGYDESDADFDDDDQPSQVMDDVATIDNMGIDDMPSLDNFDGTFSTFNSESSSGEEIGSPSEKKNSKMDVPEYLQDPGKSAQAIHTWLQRDKEG
ncbi:MAG: hypothetical protein JXR70_00515 [Spirochaetales bacterium]|nr:hypothetical protein [Spirochaetales bacterium]